VTLEGESSEHAKSMFAFAHKVEARVKELSASAGESVITID